MGTTVCVSHRGFLEDLRASWKYHYKLNEGNKVIKGMLNRVEAVIRTFDPCLTCSTHANGRLTLEVEPRSHEGKLLDTRQNR